MTPEAAVSMEAQCPLCGEKVMTVSRSGRLLSVDFQAVPLFRHGMGEGFILCDCCAFLAQLPNDITLN